MTTVNLSLEGMAGAASVLDRLGDPANQQLAANAMAESYHTDVLDWVAEGRSFTPRNGGAGLEGAVFWKSEGGGAVVAIRDRSFARTDPDTGRKYTVNPAGYAAYVEEGTGPHLILPRPGRVGLKIPTGGPGGYVIRRAVHHPGSRALPFFFNDRQRREGNMLMAAQSVLLRAAANG